MSTATATRPEADNDDDTAPNRAPAQIEGGTELAVRRGADVRVVRDSIAVLDTARFEHMQRIATVMAKSMLIPDALCMFGPANDRKMLPDSTIVANCFLVVNQAVRWNMDPFAVSQCVSVIAGKLCYEGKLIAAVLDSMLGIKLHYYLTGDPTSDAYRIYVSDKPFTEEVTKKLRPDIQMPGWRLWTGTVGEWKTTRNKGSPWSMVKNYTRMLIYRGSRDWTRIYESALMLGVLADDEIEDEIRARAARDITPEPDEDGPPAPPPPPETASPATAPIEPDPVDADFVEADDGPPAPTESAAEDATFVDLVEEKPAETVKADRPPDPLAIPADLRRASPQTDRLKGNLLRDIETLESVEDFTVWSRDATDSIAQLPAADQTEVRTAFSRRQDAIKRAAGVKA